MAALLHEMMNEMTDGMMDATMGAVGLAAAVGFDNQQTRDIHYYCQH